MGVALDTTLFADLARRRPSAIAKIAELDGRPGTKVISAPVAFEILHDILYARSSTRAALFRGWISKSHVAPLDLASAERAANIRAEFSRLGRVKAVVDLLSAGIALAGDHRLVTRDEDLQEIAEATGLVLETY